MPTREVDPSGAATEPWLLRLCSARSTTRAISRPTRSDGQIPRGRTAYRRPMFGRRAPPATGSAIGPNGQTLPRTPDASALTILGRCQFAPSRIATSPQQPGSPRASRWRPGRLVLRAGARQKKGRSESRDPLSAALVAPCGPFSRSSSGLLRARRSRRGVLLAKVQPGISCEAKAAGCRAAARGPQGRARSSWCSPTRRETSAWLISFGILVRCRLRRFPGREGSRQHGEGTVRLRRVGRCGGWGARCRSTSDASSTIGPRRDPHSARVEGGLRQLAQTCSSSIVTKHPHGSFRCHSARIQGEGKSTHRDKHRRRPRRTGLGCASSMRPAPAVDCLVN